MATGRTRFKFDGYRVLARIGRGEVRLLTRNGNDWTAKLKGSPPRSTDSA
jgi:bifunctional non-homologous end joining protein LigD